MKRTFTLTLELGRHGEDQGPFIRDANGHALYERINGIFDGTFEGARISGVREDIGLETPRMLVLSTAHITRDTNERFTPRWALGRTYDAPPAARPADLLREGRVRLDPADHPRRGRDPGGIDDCPDDLRAVLTFAHDVGCTWVMLDQDGDGVEGLPTYNW